MKSPNLNFGFPEKHDAALGNGDPDPPQGDGNCSNAHQYVSPFSKTPSYGVLNLFLPGFALSSSCMLYSTFTPSELGLNYC